MRYIVMMNMPHTLPAARADVDLYQALATVARRDHLPLSAVMRRCLRAGLNLEGWPETLTIDSIAAELCMVKPLERSEARENVIAVTNQIADDEDLWDEDSATFTRAGANVVRIQLGIMGE